jgi:hypothetical protein
MSQHAPDASRAAVATGAGAFGIVPANDLSSMRRRRSGHIIYITSMGGIVSFPGLGIYHGSKFALEPIGACSLEAYDLNPAKCTDFRGSQTSGTIQSIGQGEPR